MGTITLNAAAIERVCEDARSESLLRAAARIVVFAQALAPVGLTGHLRRSIERGDLEDGAREIWVVATALYSLFVERGTGKYAAGGRKTPWVYRGPDGRFYTSEGQRKQPFMNPALDLAAGG